MHQTRPRVATVNLGLSTPSTAGHGLKAHLVAGPSNHSDTSSISNKQSQHPPTQLSPYPTAQGPPSARPLSPPHHHHQHLRTDPMRGATVSYLSPPGASHHAIVSSPGPGLAGASGLQSNSATPPGRSGGTRKPTEHGDTAHTRQDKPTAPLPSRKQRTTSPPGTTHVDQFYGNHRVPYHPTGQHRSTQASAPQEQKVRGAWTAHAAAAAPGSQRYGPSDHTDYAYAYGDSSNSSYVSNRNSGGSSDLTTPSSPRRSPRSSAGRAEVPRSNTAASGTQSTYLYNPHHGYIRQATVVQAPSNGPSGSAGAVEAISNSGGSTSSSATASRRVPSYSNQPPPPSCTSPDRFALPSDTGSEMTVSELRSIAERQRQQLSRQAQQLQSREERLAWLRATQSNRDGSDKIPTAGSELTHEQEMRLHKLRNFRGQTEQTRLTNDNLVKEIDNFTRLLSSNEQELEACRRRKEEAQRILSLISHCLSCIVNTPGQLNTVTGKGADTRDGSATELERPIDLLSLHIPFSSDREKKRWRDGLMEADYLDRQISLALSHNGSVPRGPTSPTASTERDLSRLPASRSCKSSATIPAPTVAAAAAAAAATTKTKSTSPQASTKPSEHPNGFVSQQTSSSGFSSLLSRASSPPTSRRSSLRMLLHAANSSGSYSPGKATGSASQTGVTFSFPRLKAPPRYASRAVINDTYMRRICRDSVEKYKRTASEIYRANVDRMALKQPHEREQPQQQDSTGTDQQDESRIMSTPDRSPSASAGSETPVERRYPAESLSPTEPGHDQQPSPLDSISSSSSSSLELVGIEPAGLNVVKSHEPEPSPLGDDDAKHSSGEVDSGLGGSDDTGPSEQTQTTTSGEAPAVNSMDRAAGTVVYVVDDAQGPYRSLTTTETTNTSSISDIKSILRKSSRTQAGYAQKPADSIVDVTSDATPSSNSSQPRSNSVRFHPLALLLDAALEGDIDLVKKAAAQVSDVSEPNDEGITALHNAVCAGRMDIADFLVRTAGADVNAGDTDGWTPLHCAASCANLPLARLLVEHGASLHARTLSDQETPLEKCDQGDDEAECEEYLYFQQERLGSAASGRVYALFPRGLEAAGPGSADAHLEPDELAVWPNEPLTIIDREPMGETEWMLAEKADGTRGLIPRSHISCYPLVRVPPASLPIPISAARPRRFELWDDEDIEADGPGDDGDAEEEEEEDLTAAVDPDDKAGEREHNTSSSSPVLVEFDVSQRDTPDLDIVAEPVSATTAGGSVTYASHADSSTTTNNTTTKTTDTTVSSRLNISPVEKSQEPSAPDHEGDIRDLKTAL